MTQEDKQLLLVDLCSRLPYGVKFATKYSHFNDTHELLVINKHSTIVETFKTLWWDIEDVKPYLRPLSSMTEDEKKEYQSLCEIHIEHDADDNVTYYYFDTVESFDWLNAHHFDYRGLIPKGLAIEITDDNNPYKD